MQKSKMIRCAVQTESNPPFRKKRERMGHPFVYLRIEEEGGKSNYFAFALFTTSWIACAMVLTASRVMFPSDFIASSVGVLSPACSFWPELSFVISLANF